MDANAAATAGKTITEVGGIFGKGGTDGLILYALLIAVFLQFLALGLVVWQFSRSANRKDQLFADQAKAFAQASNDTAEALRDIATAVANSSATAAAAQAGTTQLVGRVEVALARFEGRSALGASG